MRFPNRNLLCIPTGSQTFSLQPEEKAHCDNMIRGMGELFVDESGFFAVIIMQGRTKEYHSETTRICSWMPVRV